MNTAFVLGNGRSRLNIDLNRLRGKGKIYGCNALYREFSPDVLVSVDIKMVIEICTSGYHNTHEVWSNPNSKFVEYTNLKLFSNPKGWSSGPTALLKSCLDRHERVYILGFDFQGINDRLNNVYANTKNYRSSEDTATYFGNWMKQSETIFREYNNVEFIRVNEAGAYIKRDWQMINNFKDIYYDEFNKILDSFES
jgi:hypothetical protein